MIASRKRSRAGLVLRTRFFLRRTSFLPVVFFARRFFFCRARRSSSWRACRRAPGTWSVPEASRKARTLPSRMRSRRRRGLTPKSRAAFDSVGAALERTERTKGSGPSSGRGRSIRFGGGGGAGRAGGGGGVLGFFFRRGTTVSREARFFLARNGGLLAGLRDGLGGGIEPVFRGVLEAGAARGRRSAPMW